MKTRPLIIIFTIIAISSCSINQAPYYRSQESEDILTARSYVIHLAEIESDTVELNKILKRTGGGAASSWTYTDINYLISSSNLSKDSIISLMKSERKHLSGLDSLTLNEILEVINNNYFLFSLQEIGVHYYPKQNAGFKPLKGKELDKFIYFSEIKDEDNILVIGPNNTLGFLPLFLGIIYPNSKISLLHKNEVIKENFEKHKLDFSGLIDTTRIVDFMESEINDITIPNLDKVLLYHNYYNEVELTDLISKIKKNIDKYTEVVILETSNVDVGQDCCNGYLSEGQTTSIFNSHNMIEIKDGSFKERFSDLEFILKTFRFSDD